MKYRKLYRDGSVGGFQSHQKALALASTIGLAFSVGTFRFLHREAASNFTIDFFRELSDIDRMLVSFIGAVIVSILTFIFYRRPLLVLKNGKLIVYQGLFTSDYILLDEIKHIKTYTDEESIAIDIYNKANLRTTFETRLLSNLEGKIKKIIEDNTSIKVECVTADAKS